MPQFKPIATLERSAAADLSKNTLSRIPTLSGRLIYLASLRDTSSGVYRHHGLSTIFGREQVRAALAGHHRSVFQEWLDLALSEKREDLERYLDGLEDPRELVINHWTGVRGYRGYIPASARESERELFFAEFEALLEVIRCSGSGAGGRA